MLGAVIIVPPCIDNFCSLFVIFYFYTSSCSVSLRTNELIEVKKIPVTDKVHELGQTDGTSIDGARRLRNRDSELCSPRGFGGMEYHAWLPERRPLLLGELEIVRSSRRASCSLFVFIRFFLRVFRSPPILPCQNTLLDILFLVHILPCFRFPRFSSGFHFRPLRFLPLLPTPSRISLFPN